MTGYIVTVKKGILYVASKLRVGRIVSQEEADKWSSDPNIWEAHDHIIADKAYPANYDCIMPPYAYPKLHFESAEGPKPPHLVEGGLIYQQSLRGVRRLTGGRGTASR